MDWDTIDATQAIYNSDDFDDDKTDEDHLSSSQKKPVGFLKVKEQKDLQSKEYPVYEGDNIVGRHESCQICIPSKSLSREHACITVTSGTHLICDKNSRNKVKKGKLFLLPDVRYELKHKDECMFGDVSCTYIVAAENEAGINGDSETEEETSTPGPAESKDEALVDKSDTVLVEASDEEDYASDASSDILMPTQPLDGTGSKTIGLKKSENGEEKSGQSNLSSVMETPEFLRKQAGLSAPATLVLSESCSDTEDEGSSNLQKQTLVFHDGEEDVSRDKIDNVSAILAAPTQVLGASPSHCDETQAYGSEDEAMLSTSDVDMEGATQSLQSGFSPKIINKTFKGGKSRKSVGKTGDGKIESVTADAKKQNPVANTQAYEMDVYSDSSSRDTQDKTLAVKTLELTAMETQKIDDASDKDGDETEDTKSSQKKAVSSTTGKEVQNKILAPKEKNLMMMETQKMDDASVGEEEEENLDETDMAGFLCMSTFACEEFEGEFDDKNQADRQVSCDDATQAIGDADFSEEEEKPQTGRGTKKSSAAHNDDSTAPIEDATMPVDDKPGDATVPLDDEAGDSTMPLDDKCDATMPLDDKGGDATMPVDDVAMDVADSTMPVDCEAATIAINENTEDSTMPIEDKCVDSTMPIEDKCVDSTMPIDDTGEDATLPIDEKESDDTKAEEATMPVDEGGETVPISDIADMSASDLDVSPIHDTVGPNNESCTQHKKHKGRFPETADTLPVTNGSGTQEFAVRTSSKDEIATLPITDDMSSENTTTKKAVGTPFTDAMDTVQLAENEPSITLLPQITRGSDMSEDDENTPEMVPESDHDEESTSIISLPERSPFKSALVDHTTRNRSPSPKRVAFAEPEETVEEEPKTPRKSSGTRGRKKPSGFQPESSSPANKISAQRRGRGSGVEPSSSSVTTGGMHSSSGCEKPVTAAENVGAVTETVTDVTHVESKQQANLAKNEDLSSPKISERKSLNTSSEPRRSGRSRKAKKFADDHEKEKEETGKADSSVSQNQKKNSRGRRKTAEPEKQIEEERSATHGESSARESSVEASSEKIAEVIEEVEKSCTGKETAVDIKVYADRQLEETASGEVMTSSRLKRQPRKSQQQNVVSKETPNLEEIPELMDGDDKKMEVLDNEIRQERSKRGGKTTAVGQKRASRGGAKEQAADERKKQVSDAAGDQASESKDIDGKESGEDAATLQEKVQPSEETDNKTDTTDVENVLPSESTDAKADDINFSQRKSRARGRASTQENMDTPEKSSVPVAGKSTQGRNATKSETEKKPDEAVAKCRKRSRAAKRLDVGTEEPSHEVDDNPDEAPPSKKGKVEDSPDEVEESPDEATFSKKSQIEEEPMDTDEPNESVSGRRGRGRTAKKSLPATEAKAGSTKITASKTQIKGRGNGPLPMEEDTDMSQDTDTHNRRSQATHGKPESGIIIADTASEKQDTGKSDTSFDKSSSAAPKRRGRRRLEDEEEKEESKEENQILTSGRKGGKHATKTKHEEKQNFADKGDGGDNADNSSNRKGRSKKNTEKSCTDPEVSAESEVNSQTDTASDAQVEGVKYSKARRGRQAGIAQEIEPAETSEPDIKTGRLTRKAAASEEDVSAVKKSDGGHSVTGRRGRRVKDEKRDADLEETKQDSGPDPTPTRKGRQSKTQGHTDAVSEQNTEENSQKSGPAGTGQQTKKGQGSEEQKQEGDGSEVQVPVRRGRRAKKAEETVSVDTHTESSMPPDSQGSQESVTSHSGRKGRSSSQTSKTKVLTEQSAKAVGDGAEKKASTGRGVKRRAAEALEPTTSDLVSESEPTKPEEGPSQQKRGRRAKDTTDIEAGEQNIKSPAPVKRGRQSGQSYSLSQTPVRAGGKSKEETVTSPSLRRTSLGLKPKIIFTGCVDELGEKIAKELGGQLVQSVQECTHLITDKIRRTVKFLCGVARGVMIVTPQWLKSCKSSGMFADGGRFIVSDTATEKQYKFNLKSSLQKATQSPMLEGFRIHVTKSVRPDPQQMKEILQCSGAEYVASMPKKAANNTVVISCEEDKSACQAAINAGIDVVSAEFILTGVLRQEADIKRLFGSPSDAVPSRSRR